MEKSLREERWKQQKAREYAISLEAEKMKQEFEDNLARQKAIEAKIKEEEHKKVIKSKLYAQEVMVSLCLLCPAPPSRCRYRQQRLTENPARNKYARKRKRAARNATTSSWRVSVQHRSVRNRR